MIAWLLLLSIPIANAACVAVPQPVILLRDLAPAMPLQGSPETPLGLAPQPGVIRRLEPAELRRMLRMAGVAAPQRLPTICVERSQGEQKLDRLLPALRAELPSEVELDLISADPRLAAWGRPVFRRAALHQARPSADGSVIWRGWQVDDAGRSAAAWVKVRLSSSSCAPYAARHLEKGDTLSAADLSTRCDKRPWLPAQSNPGRDLTGFQLLGSVEPGQPIPERLISAPWIVKRGQRIEVVSTAGQASIRVAATADTNARLGDRVWLRNQAGSRFQARMVAAGQARAGGEVP